MPTVYQSIRDDVRDGDVALFRGGGLIARISDGPYTHAATCLWVRDTLLLAEYREWHGGRIVTLSSQITKYPGAIDLYRPTCNRPLARYAAELMARQAGHEYGWRNIKLAALRRLVLFRFLTGWKPQCRDTTPSKWSEPKICSQAVVWSLRKSAKHYGSSWFPCEGLSDKCIEPQTIADDMGHFRLWVSGLTHASKVSGARD